MEKDGKNRKTDRTIAIIAVIMTPIITALTVFITTKAEVAKNTSRNEYQDLEIGRNRVVNDQKNQAINNLCIKIATLTQMIADDKISTVEDRQDFKKKVEGMQKDIANIKMVLARKGIVLYERGVKIEGTRKETSNIDSIAVETKELCEKCKSMKEYHSSYFYEPFRVYEMYRQKRN